MNRQTNIWDSYKWQIIAAVALILAEALLILEARALRSKRRKHENDWIIANDRLQLAFEGGGFVGWDWDIKKGRDQWFGDLQPMLGIPSGTYKGRVENFHGSIHSEDRDNIAKTLAGARQHRTPYAAEFRVIRSDGTVRWISARGKFYYGANGEAERMLGMATDITERKQTEEALRESEEKFSKAFQHSPMTLSITRAKDSCYIDVNPTFESLSGWRREEVIGRTAFDLGIWVDPRERVAFVKRLAAGQAVQNVEFHARTKSGEVHTCLGSAELIELNGEPCVLAVSANITDLKRAEAILRESEERFRLVANTAPVMIWMTGVDRLCTYVNRPWLEFTGRSFEEELGNGWAEGIHPEDMAQSLDVYTKAFDQLENFRMEYRVRRHDGQYRWVMDSGVPRFNADGSFAGYIGSAIDVTDRRLAEETLSMVSRKLIEAHEDERAWIARELHDDIGQQLFALVLNLETLRKRGNTSANDLREGIGRAIQLATNIGKDMRSISHRLHSSKLELLGLASAASGYCSEISDQYDAEIILYSEGVPKDLPAEVSLCIFRILQEALQNAIKHSQSRQFRVTLSCKSDEIVLNVRDSGIGFDPGEAIKGRGLGLTSMRERLKLIDGELSIESRPGAGTIVRVRAPLVPITGVARSAAG